MLWYSVDDNLLTAVERGKIKKVLKWLEKGANPNGVLHGSSPLSVALTEGQYEIAEILLDAGAGNFNYWNLRYSIWGDPQVLRKMLEKGANPNIWGGKKETILQWAIKMKSLEHVQLLLEYGADPDLMSKKGKDQPLLLALHECCVEILYDLLKSGANPNFIVRNTCNWSFLHYVADSGEPDEYYFHVILLLRAGAISRVDSDQQSSSRSVRAGGNEKTADLLEYWPNVVSLEYLCLKAIHFAKVKPEIPKWFPRRLLEWD